LFLECSEAVLIMLAFVASVGFWAGQDAELVLRYEGGITRAALAAGVFLICMYYLDLYDSLILTNRREIMVRLVQVLGVGTLILSGIYFVFPEVQLSLGVFSVALGIVALSLACWRELFMRAICSFGLAQRTVLVGGGPFAAEIAREVKMRPEVGLTLVGYVDQPAAAGSIEGLRYLGDSEVLATMVEKERASRIIVAMTERRQRLPIEQLLACKTEGAMVQDGCDFYEALTGKLSVSSLRLSWLLFSPGFRVSGLQLAIKRLFSLLLSSVGLVVTLPFMVIIGLLIRLDSKGPIIFKQKRVGKDGKIFTLYKFRSMYDGADKSGINVPATDDDSRCTRVGKWLRRIRLDELPQLYNIFRGDMYFVGPRPFVPDQERELAEKIPFYRQRWAVRPGATGWAQVNRGYCATLEDNTEKLAYDLFYIKNMSLGLDLLIVFKTIKILILGRGGR
jgi:sugar transferase (PEP-CTERM system associated)